MRYAKMGSGATLFVGDVGVKASSADRGASLARLQQRLGVYEPASPRQQVVGRAPEPMQGQVPGWSAYITGRKEHYAAKDAAIREQRARQDTERKQLAEQQRQRRAALLQGSWKGRGELRNAMQSIIAAEQAAEKAALKERQQKERDQVRQKFRPYPDLEQWQRQQKQPDLAEQWRHRAGERQRVLGDKTEPPTPRDIRAYAAKIVGHQVHYTDKDDQGQETAFVDGGREIDVHDWRNPDAVLAALQLSAQKWGSLKVTGAEEYKDTCAKLVAEHGFNVSNPELQGRIEQEREALAQQRAIDAEPVQGAAPGQ